MIYLNIKFENPVLSKKESFGVQTIPIIRIFSIVATCMGEFELLQEIENVTSKSTVLHLIQSFSRKSAKWYYEIGCIKKTSYNGELRIWDLYGNALLLQELKNKMSGFDCLTKEAEEEMMIEIQKLRRKLMQLAVAVSDMKKIVVN